ncbi:hypothetical protein HMPREF0742_02424 [Rothia aeria F0184]|uniref:Uncharacterized protein n=1 Tax=Rothia aeria F0184 TaxID=888019 RepID=U7UYS1_9MICC|nr:hypothetical protein HMPREF0742_02424 [Rothia aeria F0184]
MHLLPCAQIFRRNSRGEGRFSGLYRCRCSLHVSCERVHSRPFVIET